jgi:tellurite methyltransferase
VPEAASDEGGSSREAPGRAGCGDGPERWDERYRGMDPELAGPSDFVASLRDLLPGAGTALDVAGGPGGDAVLLAAAGLTTTLVDASAEAVRIATLLAAQRGVALRTVVADLEVDPLPAGPWDVVVCRHYLQRNLFPAMVAALAPGGLLCVCIATTRNLERHPRPGRRFLLDEQELPRLVDGLEIVRSSEGWTEPGPQGRHEARVVARRTGHDGGGAARLPA